MVKRMLSLFIGLALGGAAWAQGPGEAAAHRKFWDSYNKTLLAVHAGLEATDFGITHRNLIRGGRELNPIARPFCDRGTGGQTVFFAGRTAGVLGMSYLFHQAGHHRLERAITMLAISDSSYGVTYSFAHR